MAQVKKPNQLGGRLRNTLFWLILLIILLTAIALSAPRDTLKDTAFSDVINRANNGQIAKIEIEGNNLKVTPKGKKQATQKSYKEGGSSIYEQGLKQNATKVEVKEPSTASSTAWNVAGLVLPILWRTLA